MWILERLGWEAARFREDVERALGDETADVAMRACRVIAAIDEPTAATVERLLGRLEDTFSAGPAVAALQDLLREPREGLRAAARPLAEALLATEGRRQALLTGLALRAGLAIPFDQCVAEYREDPGGRWFFMGQMIRYGPYTAEEAVPFAVRELEKGAKTYIDAHLMFLMQGLVRYGADAAPAAPVALELLEHADNDVREAAARLLGAIGPKARPALDRLDRLAESDPDKAVKACAARAAARVRDAKGDKR
jgi:hypothetical protein